LRGRQETIPSSATSLMRDQATSTAERAFVQERKYLWRKEKIVKVQASHQALVPKKKEVLGWKPQRSGKKVLLRGEKELVAESRRGDNKAFQERAAGQRKSKVGPGARFSTALGEKSYYLACSNGREIDH